MSPRPLVLLEFNELSPVLVERFIAQGLLPNFARLKAESYAFITDAGEDPPNLNPWIQWVTFHSGMPFSDHGVFHLSDASNKKVPMIWDAVSAQGHSSWVCGSMNTSVQPGFKGALLPDPWDAKTSSIPDEMENYMRLVRSFVFEYTSDRLPVTPGILAKFMTFMLRNGLRARTAVRILGHLIRERFQDVKWKRASILDWLQFDLFLSVYKKRKPMLATFFSNSTAHYQHVYWRNMEPELFALKPSSAEQRSKRDAVLFGYQEMDRMIGEVLRTAPPDAVIAFATALSQQPCLAWEESGGKTFYKPRSFPALLEFAGIDARECRIEPVMSEQFHLRFADSHAAEKAKAAMDSIRLEGGRAVFYSRLEGDSVFAGCGLYDHLRPDVRMQSSRGSASLGDLLYQVESLKSGMHHRDGLLWVRVPGRHGISFSEKIPLTSAVPLLLKCMRLDNASWLDGRVAQAPLPAELAV